MTARVASQASAQRQRDEAVEWMNRGQRQTQENAKEAFYCYTKAIQLLFGLDRSDHPDWSNSLGAAFMNRGRIRHQLEGIESAAAVEADYVEAEAVLAEVSDHEYPWVLRNRAGVSVNRSNLLLGLNQSWSARYYGIQAVRTLEPLLPSEDVVDFQLYLLAKRSLCDALGQLLPMMDQAEFATRLAHEAGDHVDDALILIRQWRVNGEEPFSELSLRFFRFGAELYGRHQPQFLIEFLDDHFVGLKDKTVEISMTEIALESIVIAMTQLSGRVYELSGNLDVMDRARDLMALLLEAHERYQLRKGIA